VVRSVALSFNHPDDSTEVAATAQLRTVTLVFNVTAPARLMARAVLSTLPGSSTGWTAGCHSGTRAV